MVLMRERIYLTEIQIHFYKITILANNIRNIINVIYSHII
jgi:hypothetical protein